MRKFVLMAVVVVVLSGGVSKAQNGVNWAAQKKTLETQQKLERHDLKMQQHSRMESWKNQKVTSAQRTQAKHEMAREWRDMKLKQKDARQDLADRQRSLQAMQQNRS